MSSVWDDPEIEEEATPLPVAPPPVEALTLNPEQLEVLTAQILEKVAREIVPEIAERVVREIVPEMAERLVREELEKVMKENV